MTVEDTGIGMDEQTCSRMFEQFYRGEAGRREGSGLGLPLARRIAELHGGTITGESRAGEGPLYCASSHIDAGRVFRRFSRTVHNRVLL